MYVESNNGKAFFYSVIVYMLLVGACFFGFLTLPYTQKQVNTGGIEVNFGNSNKGKGTDYTSTENPSVAPRSSRRVTSEAVHSLAHNSREVTKTGNIITQNNEDAASVDVKKKAGKFSISTKTPDRAVEKINSNALYKGAATTGKGGGDGNTDEAGNQGKANGSVLSHSYTGTGIGGGGIALNLEGRNFIARPTLSDDGQSEGKITVQITVNRDGNITTAKAGGRGTTIQNATLWRKCEDAAKQARLNAIADGPEIQAGVVIFSFKLQ